MFLDLFRVYGFNFFCEIVINCWIIDYVDCGIFLFYVVILINCEKGVDG